MQAPTYNPDVNYFCDTALHSLTSNLPEDGLPQTPGRWKIIDAIYNTQNARESRCSAQEYNAMII